MLAAVNPHGGEDPLVFWSDGTPDKRCDYNLTECGLYRALAEIGIDEAERRRRNLSFHSWCYWLNSQLIEAHVALEKIRSVTGRSSSEMTMLYYHAQTSEMDGVRDIQARLEGCFISGESGCARRGYCSPIDTPPCFALLT
jgi:hypothetical protein